MPFGKNTDALFLHALMNVSKDFCLATIGAMCFSARSFGCAPFYFANERWNFV